MKEQDFCKCDNSSSSYTEVLAGAIAHCHFCSDCNKPIEDTFEYFQYGTEDYYG